MPQNKSFHTDINYKRLQQVGRLFNSFAIQASYATTIKDHKTISLKQADRGIEKHFYNYQKGNRKMHQFIEQELVCRLTAREERIKKQQKPRGTASPIFIKRKVQGAPLFLRITEATGNSLKTAASNSPSMSSIEKSY